jgi:hypothetical protein
VSNDWWSSLNNISFSYSLASRCSRYEGISSILILVFFEVDGGGYNSGGTVSHGQARGWWGGSEGGMGRVRGWHDDEECSLVHFI